MERVKLAYEDGVDTLEEYKAKKKAITDEIDKLKDMLEQTQEEEPKERIREFLHLELLPLAPASKQKEIKQ